MLHAALPQRLQHEREAVPVRRGIVVVADEDDDVRPDSPAEAAHRRQDARRRSAGETAGQGQAPARTELQEDAVPVLDDSSRRRIPVERRPGRVGEDRDALLRPLLTRDRGRREGAAEAEHTEECEKPTHRAGL
jgi:hypothetical protein